MEHERVITNLVQDFETGKINRRQLIRGLAVAAGAAAGTTSVPAYAAGEPVLKATGILHVSYQVASYAKTRDFYSGILGMKVANDTGERCDLSIGHYVMIARNGTLTSASTKAGKTPLIDHICYSIDNWNKERIFAELKRRGLNPQPEGDKDLQIKDPDGYHIQLSARQEMK